MNHSQLYRKWKQWVMQQLPEVCESRIINLVYWMVGIYLAQSVHAHLVARKLPIRSKKASIVRRLGRFLENEAVAVEAWYEPWARELVRQAAMQGRIHLVVDTTKVTSSHRLLCVAIAYRRRTLPLMWSWVGHAKGHCTLKQQLALFQRLQAWLPEGVEVSLVGDGEFGNVQLLEQLDAWQWHYALRQAKDTLVLLPNAPCLQRLDQLPVRRGHARYWQHVLLTHASYPTHLLVIWRANQPQPLFLATNVSCSVATWRLYKRRMWIEQMFGDWKGHGFDLEKSRLRHPARLNRLVLLVSLIYLWLLSVGEYVLQHHLAEDIDRRTRTDLSLFRLGWDFLERCLAFDDPIPECFLPNLCFMSGS